jgi:hypothetical protein
MWFCSTDLPKRISRELLTGAIADRPKEGIFGCLKSPTLRFLQSVGKDASSSQTHLTSGTRTTPGTLQVREWQGTSQGSRRSTMASSAVAPTARLLTMLNLREGKEFSREYRPDRRTGATL